MKDIEVQADELEQYQSLVDTIAEEEMTEEERLISNINLLQDVEREMTELWKYHPINPYKEDLVERFDELVYWKNKIVNQIS